MRKEFLLLSLFWAFMHFEVRTQTLTQSVHEPVPGEVDRNYRLDTSAYTSGLPSAVTGSNVVWDFSRVQGAFPVLFDSIVAPSSLSSGSLFPASTYAQKRGSIISFFQSVTSPSRTELLGVYSPSLTVTFTNSAIIADYPVSYGYSSTDPVTGTFKYNNTNGVCNGSITVVADGIGILLLPDNVSFSNVLRVRSSEQLTMTTGFFPVGTIKQTIISYYVPGKKYPVITAQYQEYALVVGTPTITAQAYGNFDYFTVAGINEEPHQLNLTIYPNPFKDLLSYKGPEAESCEFFIYSSSGSLVFSGLSLERFSGRSLPEGFYILEIRKGSQRIFRKILRSEDGS